jgi:amino acid adenylation domain-containing protein
LVERAGRTAPNAPAVFGPDRALTYAELERDARDLAFRLREECGVGPGSVVGVYASRSASAIVALLGVLRAGGAYLPLDSSYPSARLEQIVEDGRPVALVAERTTISDARSLGCGQVIEVPDPADLVVRNDGSGISVPADVCASDPAYVIFTSGSTGRPKGVVVEHRQATWSTLARHSVYADRPPEAFLLLSSIAFDSSVAGIFWTLSAGGALVIPSLEEAADPEGLAFLARRHSVTHLLAVPSAYGSLLDSIDHPDLTTVIVAGEECPRSLLDRHLERHPGVSLYNEYGPTETTVWATVARLDTDGDVTLGRPVPGAEVAVYDSRMNPCPPGMDGDIWIGGEGLSRGYLNRPDLTAERFRPDPARTDGTLIYRTGDRGRIATDGRLEFLGRHDLQVKIGGARVELAEIEATLCRHPEVDQAVAILTEASPDGPPRIAAFVTAAEGLDPGTVLAWLSGRLPSFMMPGWIRRMDALPKLPNGKLDRASLNAMSGTEPDLPAGPPETPAEELVVELCSTLLELEPTRMVASTDNFFALGGHSLMLMRLRQEILERTGVELDLREMLAGPTIREIAKGVERTLKQGSSSVDDDLIASGAGAVDDPDPR